jgi:PHD/YefM family antitoxin component YafN of YafNO toxin-antitoxin module
MKKIISNVEFRRSFGEILDHVKKTKKPVCITQHGVPWVVLKHPLDLKNAATDYEPALNVRQKLSAHINAVHYQQKPLVITRRSTAVACICPVINE